MLKVEFEETFLEKMEEMVCESIKDCDYTDCDKCMKDFAEQFKNFIEKSY